MAAAQELREIEDLFGAHNYLPLDVVLSFGEGVWVFDQEGKRYLDCLSAYSALSHGHRHPRILQAMQDQAARLTLTSRAFRNDQLGMFYRELSEYSGFECVLPMNTGTEAVETAIKLARKWAYEVKGIPQYEAEILVFANNFHGRTVTVISFSSEALYRDSFGAFTPGFRILPYGDPSAVEQAITPRTAAVLVEPIQGEAGVILPPEGFLQQLRDTCDANRMLLIADEIQTGLGRTGTRFACDHEGVRPDILVLGKALGGGIYPVSAVLADRTLLGLFHPGEHGSTFGGNPLAAAIGRAAIRVLVEERLAENAHTMGEYLITRLRELHSPLVREIRGRGLLVGVELTEEAGHARTFCEALMRKGVLAKETHTSTIRIAPPLIIDRPTIDWAMDAISPVLAG
jgi:ornithine--oxo-acid transaminase